MNISPATRLLMLITTLNASASSISSIFINIYLFKVSNEFYQVFTFHFFSFLSMLPCCVAAGWLSKKTNRKIGLLVGNGLLLLFYSIMLIFGDTMSGWIPLAGLIYGASQGFYWLSVNVLSIDLTKPENRDWFNGLSGTFTSITQMISPFAAGWIIVAFPGNLGYRYIFGFALALFVLSIICAAFLPSSSKKSPMYWGKIREIHKSPKWRNLSRSFTTLHFRDDILAPFVWVSLFIATQNESIIGNYSLLMTALSTVSFFVIGRFGRQERKRYYMMIGGIGFSAALLAFIPGINTETLLIYAIVGGICNPMFQVPFSTLLIDTIAEFDENGKYRIELVIAREIAISLGRIFCAFCLVLLFRYFPVNTSLLNITLAVLTAAGLLPLILTRKMFH
ncbi:MFS transporter [Paenibacillus sp. LMG 31458]|uniref:MFS transporter n=1 Tax=Paenibacillus phytorum TaxID=2654977 RepID=A0ABX1XZV6_9BACL|nr:MFS transporter [Paenibacillus phytorum]NOU73551.1 MFS transporter [Paenibacillus phytorum]